MNDSNFIHSNPFVVMAGGVGKINAINKKYSKTYDKSVSKPIIQHIIESASSNGFYNFYISVNI